MLDNTIESKLNMVRAYEDTHGDEFHFETELIALSESGVAMKAFISDDKFILATGHSYVSFEEGGDKAMEWAETIALRRAIGFFLRNHAPSAEEIHAAGLAASKKMIEEYKGGAETWQLAGQVKATSNEVIKGHLQSAMEHILSQEAKKNA